MAKDLFAVGIEPHAPQAHARHQLLRLLEFAVPSKDGVDEFAAAVLAHGQGLFFSSLFLSSFPHVLLAHFEEFGEPDPEAFATLEEVFNQLAALLSADLGHGLFCALDLAGELDEEEPKLARHLRQRCGGTMVEDGPVVDPLAQ